LKRSLFLSAGGRLLFLDLLFLKIAGMSAFVISKRQSGHYKFTFSSRKGKTIFTSIACKDKSDCQLIINTIQEDLESFTFTRKQDTRGKFFFRLSRGGLVLANSRKYSTDLTLQKNLDLFLRFMPEAVTLDFSEDEPVFPEAESASE
jgi:uncharacterized protein YegP (UPF0339 family)